MVAKLGLRKQNLSWQLSLEVLSLLGRKGHETEYQSGCKSVPCVLEPIINTLGPKDLFDKRGVATSLLQGSPLQRRKKMERVCFENDKTLALGFSSQLFEKL